MTDGRTDELATGASRVPWSDLEVGAVVDVYFRMLELELASAPYTKAKFNREVQALTGRSRESVEFKFANISYVLDQMGCRFVDGYKPRSNAQKALRMTVVERLTGVRPDSDWGGYDEPIITPPVDPNVPEYRRRYSGVCMDPVLRKAIEVAAVEQATEYYESLGFEVLDVGLTHSYDLRVTREGEERHIEVKGSQGHIETIQLTRNEVDHANTFGNTDLVVVREIGWERGVDGSISTRSGLMTVIPNWRPSPEHLAPTNYNYFLG